MAQLFLVPKIPRMHMELRPEGKHGETKEKLSRFAFANHQGRDSEMSTAVPVWGNGTFKPASVRVIRGKTEQLLGMNIIRALILL